MRYLIHDAVGNIVRSGKTLYPELLVPKSGQTLVAVDDHAPVFEPATHSYDLVNKRVVPIPVDQAAALVSLQETTSDKLSVTCQKVIQAGFSSSATGTSLLYASQDKDQSNMVQASIVGGNLSAKGASGWTLVPHTVDQAKKVLSDFVTFKDAQRGKLAQKRGLMSSAKTPSDVKSVTWSS